MAHSPQVKHKAIELRKAGYSIKEIAKILAISISTASVWMTDIIVESAGKERMKRQSVLHRYNTSLRWKQKRLEKSLFHQSVAHKILGQIGFTDSINKLLCALLFWAEGAKTSNRVAFTNSDPKMVALFLHLLRCSYEIDEEKFRISLHLHEYHDRTQVLSFWSEITNIPIRQFTKPYVKPHTGMRKKANYKGCVTVRYYNSEIACQLEALYNSVLPIHRAVVQW